MLLKLDASFESQKSMSEILELLHCHEYFVNEQMEKNNLRKPWSYHYDLNLAMREARITIGGAFSGWPCVKLKVCKQEAGFRIRVFLEPPLAIGCMFFAVFAIGLGYVYLQSDRDECFWLPTVLVVICVFIAYISASCQCFRMLETLAKKIISDG